MQDHYEDLEQPWPERFEKRYGLWRPYLKEVMDRWRHSAFNVYHGPRILPREKRSLGCTKWIRWDIPDAALA